MDVSVSRKKTNNERKNGNGKDKGDANHSMTATGNPKKTRPKRTDFYE